MKNIKLIILSAFITVLSVACSESFLDTAVLTSKTDENYYSTADECNEALVGCYDAMQLIWADGVALPVASTVMGDLTFGSTGAGDGEGYPMLDEFDKNVSPSDLNMFEENWKSYYKGIFRCNKLIEKIDNADWTGNEGQRNEILAEAHFLRAFLYFDLVRMFERVPLLKKQTKENVPQSEPDETYTLITKDLLFAVENGNTKTYAQIASSDYGHANVWAAKSLLARVYMYYTGYYGKSDLVGLLSKSEALQHLEDVIADSGYDLLENYFDLWPAAATYQAAKNSKPITESTYAGETNKEIVFAIKYTYTSDYDGNTDGNHWMVMNGLRNQAVAKYGYGEGWGACTVVPELYNDWDSEDTRRAASIMAVEEENIDYEQIKDVKEYTGYFTKKYTPTCDENGNSIAVNYGAPNFMIGQFQDYYCIRFADVLLMAAELESNHALAYLNRVRERANVDLATSVDKDVIYEERKYEFAFEGMRYWDLLRYESSLNYAADKVSYNGPILRGGNEETKVIDGANLIATKGLFQIPYNQITLSDGVLKQNEGW